jgi:exonuclease SbcC
LIANQAEWQSEFARLPVTEYTLDYLIKQEDQHTLVTRVEQKLKLKAKNVPHDCPACKHHWEEADPRLETEFAQVPDVAPIPALTMQQIASARLALNSADRHAELLKKIADADTQIQGTVEHAPLINSIEVSRKAYAAAETARANQARLVDLEAQIKDVEAKFEKTTDRVGVIGDIKTADGAHQMGLVLKQQYDIAKQEQDVAKQELASIPANLDTLVAEAQTALQAAQAYVLNVARFDADMVKFEDLLAKLNGHKNDLEDWKKGRDAIAELRAKVKGYIVPALNSVATKLVNEMTGGELSQVSITEEMEITVDGQDLETLSGAGKGVTNLCLRLALGQVLTNSVFPMVMLDEVDASFDDDRAEFTANCLRRLAKVYKQVLLISHKPSVDADHYVRL